MSTIYPCGTPKPAAWNKECPVHGKTTNCENAVRENRRKEEVKVSQEEIHDRPWSQFENKKKKVKDGEEAEGKGGSK